MEDRPGLYIPPTRSNVSPPVPTRPGLGRHRVAIGIAALLFLALLDQRGVGHVLTALLILIGVSVAVVVLLAVRFLRRPIVDLTVFDAVIAGAMVRWWQRRHR